jgi:hypothetical protein
VVGERVGQLGRDRADLPADAPKVVQQPRTLDRKLREQRCECEEVDAAILGSASSGTFS